MINGVNILYLSYWDAKDPLTKATVLPNLKILESLAEVGQIVWCNVERSNSGISIDNPSKVIHEPINSYVVKYRVLGQVLDFIFIPYRLKSILKKHSINLIIARSSPAGSLIYLLQKKLNIDYVVESFEPHSDYMRYSGIWSRYGIKYYFQKRWEIGQIKTAFELYPVSENYKIHLEQKGVDSKKIKVMPCAINIDKMQFDQEARLMIREELNWSGAIIGIYTGKFGGLYFESESLQLFKLAFDEFGDDFRLIILTNEPKSWVLEQLQVADVPVHRTFVKFVEHENVSNYLSAADFTFAPIKNSVVSKFCSAVKVGESWSVGLPVLLTKDVGDDSEIIMKQGGGVIFEPTESGLLKGIAAMRSLIEQGVNKDQIRNLAQTYRSYAVVRKIYSELLKKVLDNNFLSIDK